MKSRRQGGPPGSHYRVITHFNIRHERTGCGVLRRQTVVYYILYIVVYDRLTGTAKATTFYLRISDRINNWFANGVLYVGGGDRSARYFAFQKRNKITIPAQLGINQSQIIIRGYSKFTTNQTRFRHRHSQSPARATLQLSPPKFHSSKQVNLT